MKTDNKKRMIANNKKAYHDYFLEETFEAGISSEGNGSQISAHGKMQHQGGFCSDREREVMLYQMHIPPYEKGNIFNRDPLRPRKLLMHKAEIRKLLGKIKEKGYTLVPVEVYFSGSLVKVKIALARGKKLYDKRADIAKKDQRREAQREFKVRNLG